jgi:fructose-1,6-bisphosphatase/inositol monophosphatase family enzyme
MNDEIKSLANKTVDKIYRKVKRAYLSDFHSFGINVGIGADGTPTKYIDKIAEDVAINFIKKSDINVNILSEESGFLDFNGEYTFVLDPVDGTRNAYRGIPYYSVSLGVGKNMLKDIEYGVVKNIPTGDIYFAEKMQGAFLNKKRFLVPDMPAKEILSSITLGKNCDKLTLSLAKEGNVRSLGSASLEICMVAIGALDYYVVGSEYLRVTDIAASVLIIREAGGIVTNIFGKELDMALNLDERTSIIAACNEEIIRKIVPP